MTYQKQKLSRGDRNNNPGNIRKTSTEWVGEVDGPDKAFETFKDRVFGFRAIFIILRTYYRLYGCKTIRGTIERWAPKNENNTKKYVDFVSKRVGIGANTQYSLLNKKVMCDMVGAMAAMECGHEFERKEIEDAYEMVKF